LFITTTDMYNSMGLLLTFISTYNNDILGSCLGQAQSN
jgi:hypothetical protein